MAAKTEIEADLCTFQWKIENVSQCWWFVTKDRITSPAFIVNELEGSKWSLWLYLRGCLESELYDEEILVELHRETDCRGPYSVAVKYTLAFLHDNGLILKEETNTECFVKDQTSLSVLLEDPKIVYVSDRKKFLPEDTLTIQCRFQKAVKAEDKEELVKTGHLYAQTIFKVIRKSTDWRIDNFSTLRPGARKKFKNDLIEFDLVLNGDSDKNIDVDMISCRNCVKYLSFDTSVVDSEGKKKSCGIKRYLVHNFKKGVLSSILIFPKQFLENKDRYLPNDVFPLNFDIVLSTVEHIYYKKKSTKSAEQKKYENMVVLTKDLKSVYGEGLFSDVELRVSTHTFPAHKIILSARSPVFKKMFSNDMRESNSGHVVIDDLEFGTVHQMLLFMYAGFLEDLQLESASKLYTAANKYEVLSLKCSCSTFLKENLSPENACDVLLLADLHHDEELKTFVQDYMLEHDEVFKSLVWKPFMENNLELAAEILYRKVIRDAT